MVPVAATRAWRRPPLAANTASFSTSARLYAPTLLSSRFVPTQRADSSSSSSSSSSTASEPTSASLSLLQRGGYLRTTASGVYTLLPNALRVLHKLQAVVEREMERIHASRMEMPTLLARRDWERSGRWKSMGSELFKLKDRKGSDLLLAPTHEEEVTRIVGDEVHTQRALPVRVWQMTRKHRDEPRPRMGLLRTREFLMKDLYTFDASLDDAKRTYDDVRGAYARIFDSLLGGGEWLAAEADTGAMGGSLSHEYHVEDPAGEDTLLSCTACGRSANVELATSRPRRKGLPSSASELVVHLHGSDEGGQLTAIILPSSRQASEVKLAKLLPQGAQEIPRPVGLGWDWKERPEGPLARFDSLAVVADSECVALEPEETQEAVLTALIGSDSQRGETNLARSSAPPRLADLFPSQLMQDSPTHETAAFASLVSFRDVRVAESGDGCGCGEGELVERRAIEIGHTFVLGSRYSDKLGVGFVPAGEKKGGKEKPAKSKAEESTTTTTGRLPFQMGCYGIGLTRLIGVLAHRAAQRFPTSSGVGASAKDKLPSGLVWPSHLAPFSALVLPSSPLSDEKLQVARRIADALGGARDVDLSPLLAAQGHSAAPSDLRLSPTSSGDVALDDRGALRTGEKLAEADLVGYPLVVVVGKEWEKGSGKVELRWWQWQTEGEQAVRRSELVELEKLIDLCRA